MIYQAFSIFDSAALIYSPPFFQATKGLALRMFSDTAKDTSTNIGRHPTDFTLFHVGEFDDQSGAYIALATPDPLIKASETLPSDEPMQPLQPLFKDVS